MSDVLYVEAGTIERGYIGLSNQIANSTYSIAFGPLGVDDPHPHLIVPLEGKVPQALRYWYEHMEAQINLPVESTMDYFSDIISDVCNACRKYTLTNPVAFPLSTDPFLQEFNEAHMFEDVLSHPQSIIHAESKLVKLSCDALICTTLKCVHDGLRNVLSNNKRNLAPLN